MTITALMGLGEMRRRQEAAKKRGERFKADPEVREARARIAAEREATFDQAEAEAKAKQEASPSAFQAILNRGSIDELAEVSRSIGRLDPRRIEEIVGEIFRAKSRLQAYQPDEPVLSPTPSPRDLAEIALGAGGSTSASSARRSRQTPS